MIIYLLGRKKNNSLKFHMYKLFSKLLVCLKSRVLFFHAVTNDGPVESDWACGVLSFRTFILRGKRQINSDVVAFLPLHGSRANFL